MPNLGTIDLTLTDDDNGDNPAIDAESRVQLYSAIATVSDQKLREVIAKLAKESTTLEKSLFKELVVTRKRNRALGPRWEKCKHCKEEFDVNEEREDDECLYHPGSLRVNYAAFEDWDEDCHGPMDSAQNRRDYPENFTWSCCGEGGESGDGCIEGVHVPIHSQKRPRA